jgi:hypothetical protein
MTEDSLGSVRAIGVNGRDCRPFLISWWGKNRIVGSGVFVSVPSVLSAIAVAGSLLACGAESALATPLALSLVLREAPVPVLGLDARCRAISSVAAEGPCSVRLSLLCDTLEEFGISVLDSNVGCVSPLCRSGLEALRL